METKPYEIEFKATRNTSAPLTWSQLSTLNWTSQEGDDPLRRRFYRIASTPDEPVSLYRVLVAVRNLVEKHEITRTLYTGLNSAEPRQHIQSSGLMPVMVRDMPDAGARDLAMLCEEDDREYLRVSSGGEPDWPVRFWALRDEDGITNVLLSISHFSVDLWGANVLHQEFETMLASSTLETASSVDPIQPADVAREQRSPAGGRRNRRALEFWKGTLMSVPATMLSAEVGSRSQPRFRRARLKSEALAAAERRASAKYNVGGHVLILAAVSLLLKHYSGSSWCWMEVISNNRTRHDLRYSASAVNQNGLFALRPKQIQSFSEFANDCARQTLQTYRTSSYDPNDMDAVFVEVEQERAVKLDRSCFFSNNRSRQSEEIVAGGDIGMNAIKGLRASSRVDWIEKHESGGTKFYIKVENSPPEVSKISLYADTLYLPCAAVESFLFDIESILVEVAERDLSLDSIADFIETDTPTAERG